MENMSEKLRWFLAICSVAVFAGCGSVESKKIDYKSSGKLPPLEVPPDLTQPTRDDRYAVPDSGSKGSTTFSTYTGERAGQPRADARSDVLPQVSNMRIDRSGTQRWLVVSGMPPDKLWPTVKDFWQESGFIVNVELPEAGVMETDWAENRAKIPQDGLRNWLGKALDSVYSTAERDKFRTRLEKGEAGVTEIYISHRGMYEIYVTEGRSETKWQPRPAEPELEAEMLRRLMVRLGATDAQTKTQAAKPVAVEEKAKLARATDGSGTLELQEGYDRAWRRVGLALDRVGFTVEDRDRSQGLYFVRYVDSEPTATKDDKSFTSKLMFWKSDAPKVDPTARYRIYLKGTDNASTVQVLTREGGVDKSDTSKKILGLLYEQLK
jgi:outer membrane protein assembly factor BamC